MDNITAAPQPIHGDQEFQEQVVKSEVPVMVDFYADWCGPCKLAEPIMEKLAQEFAGQAKIIKMDTDDPNNRPIAINHRVMSIPTVIVYKGGQVVAQEIGFIGEDRYRQLLEKAVTA